jgi:hypothetical protein
MARTHPAARHEAFIKEEIRFKPPVFSGNEFPSCDFDNPAAIAQLIGSYKITTTFYDVRQNRVSVAKKPGRYGAIVKIRAADGQIYKRFATLFRSAREVNWRTTKNGIAPTLPAELGIDPAVVADKSRAINDVARQFFIAGFGYERNAAPLLAWLYESKSAARNSTGPFNYETADQKWWFTLKQKTGDQKPLGHLLFTPADNKKSSTKKWPLLLSMHGIGERSYNLDLVKTTPIPRMLARRKDFPFIVVSPQCPPRQFWNPWELNALLDDVCKKYRVDKNRIYATGYSMGGFGTWALACAFPNRLAAIAPLCGGGDIDAMSRVKNLPTWAFHGAKDPAVLIEQSIRCVDALKKLGSPVKFTIYPEIGHDVWTPTYANEKLYKWFHQQQRS